MEQSNRQDLEDTFDQNKSSGREGSPPPVVIPSIPSPLPSTSPVNEPKAVDFKTKFGLPVFKDENKSPLPATQKENKSLSVTMYVKSSMNDAKAPIYGGQGANGNWNRQPSHEWAG